MTDLHPVRVRVRAPRPFTFQCLATHDRSSPVWLFGLEPHVLSRDGDSMLVRRRRRTLGRVVPSVERVRLFAPDRIEVELLDGSICRLRESLVLEADGEAATRLVWSAEVQVTVPLAGRLLERLLAARLLTEEARRTLDRWRVTIEAAALASGLVDAPASR